MPKLASVEDVKPSLSLIEEVKPKVKEVSQPTETYYEADTTLEVGQTMGLLLALTYAEEHPNTTQIRQ